MLDIVVVYQVHRRHENQVEDHHIEDTDTILNAGVPDDTPIAVGDHYGKKATPKLNTQRCYKIIGEDVFKYKAETQQVADGRGDKEYRQVDKYNYPPGEYFQLVDCVDEEIPFACHTFAAAPRIT
jgi:hypothetical protein